MANSSSSSSSLLFKPRYQYQCENNNNNAINLPGENAQDKVSPCYNQENNVSFSVFHVFLISTE